MAYADLPDFVTALRTRRGVAARALEFTILTGSRSGETRWATFGEFDLKAAGIWTIPPERMKAGRQHRVPLGLRAIAIVAEALSQARLIAGKTIDRQLVFPDQRRGRPLSDMALIAVMRRLGHADVTVHGCRSAFRTWAAERTNFAPGVAEAALAHVAGDKRELAYQRGDLFSKRQS
jgi:integrase